MHLFKLARLTLGTLMGAALILGSGAAYAVTDLAWTPESGSARAPSGFVAFCQTTPSECVVRGDGHSQVLTEKSWGQLEAANKLANLIVTPMTDLEHYKTDEVWTLPGSFGDCEDYVLLKRKWLMQQGWPSGALLISVVFDEVGEGHAVLVARTDRGDFVLDNKTDEIRLWTGTGYKFVKRQSVTDPSRWVRIAPMPAPDMATAAPSEDAAPAAGWRGTTR